ncbi:MAG: beta-glucosidase BglX [Candidatus Limisoma sp.]
MKLNKLVLASALLLTSAATALASNDAKMDKFIDDLMGKMTVQEKIGQLNLPVTGEIVTGQAKSSDVASQIKAGKVGGLFNLKGVDRIRDVQRVAVEEGRLHIPLLFGMDVVHGYETVYPIPLALSCSWDMPAIQHSARVAAIEASADGICWTFSPMVDICQDARWGRIAEGSGEDPYLGSRIAEAMVKGYQGDLTRNDEILACVKHFALYGAPEAGRDYNSVDMSHWRMFNEYFPPYKAAIEAGAGSVMASFNIVDGVPATGNRWLMTEILREKWNFDGFVVTDYTGIYEMIAHGMGDLQDVGRLALQAGVDMDMVSDAFVGTLEKSLEEGLVSMSDIDTACRRILEAKYRLGLFDDPYKYCDLSRPAKQVYIPEHRADARKLATETFVLLKNQDNLLPLQAKGKIALIGPLANTRENMPGTWAVAAVSSKYSTLVEGFKAAVGNKAEILYAKGCNLMYDETDEKNATPFGRAMRDNRSDKEMLDEALAVAAQSDVIVAALGESSEMSGECSSRSDLEMPSSQRDLLKALLATGKPVILLHFSGRPVVLTWENENVKSILQVWFGGSETADAIADVVFGKVAPSGKLTTSFPQCVGQEPLHYNAFNTGRPILPEDEGFVKFKSNYLDVRNDALFPFGYGLSYTTFDYSDLTLSAAEMSVNGAIEASVTITNTGNYDADEVVQMYIRDMVGSVVRPVKELKGFQRISLKKGESKKVTFTIDAELLKFYNAKLDFVCEPGEFEVMVGPNSRDVKVKKFFLK